MLLVDPHQRVGSVCSSCHAKGSTTFFSSSSEASAREVFGTAHPLWITSQPVYRRVLLSPCFAYGERAKRRSSGTTTFYHPRQIRVILLTSYRHSLSIFQAIGQLNDTPRSIKCHMSNSQPETRGSSQVSADDAIDFNGSVITCRLFTSWKKAKIHPVVGVQRVHSRGQIFSDGFVPLSW